MTRDELELHRQHLDITEELLAAKQAHRAGPTEETRARLLAAKTSAREFAALWRGIREFFRPSPADGDGIARPTTIRATAQARS